MKSALDKLELRIQSFIESSTLLFSKEVFWQTLANRLVKALEEASIIGENGHLYAPGHFLIHLNEFSYSEWHGQQDFIVRMENILEETAIEAEIQFDQQPRISVTIDQNLSKNEYFITAEPLIRKIGLTEAITVDKPMESKKRNSSAFVIVNGSNVVPLTQTVINIGRRPENHIVLSDPRVSRNHAQIRFNKGKYFLFDLDSTGGTFINGHRISQQLLKLGDVISISGVTIIYGEELIEEDGDTSELNTRE